MTLAGFAVAVFIVVPTHDFICPGLSSRGFAASPLAMSI
jgi:hypothetical protein